MFIMPSFKKSLIVEQFHGNYLKPPSFFSPMIVAFLILEGFFS